MATQGQTYVFSHNPPDAKPVATLERTFGGVASAAVQVIALTDGELNTFASVVSYAGGNPQKVALTDPAGAHITALSAWVGNTVNVAQTGAPWTVVGSQGVTQLGGPWSVTGSVLASQVGAPWTVNASVSGQLTATASVVGQVTVTASCVGQQTVTASVVGTLPVTGTVTVSQGTNPWTVTGSVLATQGAAPWTVTGSVTVTNTPTTQVIQVSSPWVVYVSTTVGAATSQVSVWVVNTPSVAQGTNPWTVSGSVQATAIGSVGASQLGNWIIAASAYVQGAQATHTPFTVNPVIAGARALDPAQTSFTFVDCGDAVVLTSDRMGRLRVVVDTGAIALSGQSTVTASIAGNVPVTQVGAPWSVSGSVQATAIGSVGATQLGAPWSISGSVQATAIGSVGATQLGAPWSISGSVQGTVIGSVGVTQVSSPWVMLAGSSGAIGLTVSSVVGQVTVTASCIGQQTVTASVVGQATVTASVVGQVTVTASLIGQPTVTASVVGQLTATASVTGQLTVTASVVGAIATTLATPTYQFAKIAWEVQSSLPFPYDGGAVVRSVGTGILALATDVLSSDLSGLAVMIVSSSTALGHIRTITGWADQTNRVVNVSPNWSPTPSSGNQYTLLLDCRSAQSVAVRTEIASSTARLYYAFGIWANVQSGNTALSTNPQNLPGPCFDVLQAIDPIGTSFGALVSSYWPAENKGVAVRGFLGCKVYVTSANAKFSLWGTAG